jgi:hypothetical protein
MAIASIYISNSFKVSNLRLGSNSKLEDDRTEVQMGTQELDVVEDTAFENILDNKEVIN